MIKVLVNGANGKMGQAACEAIRDSSQCELVASADKGDDLSLKIADSSPDVVLELTQPDGLCDRVKAVLAQGIHCVVGATGLTDADHQALNELALAHNKAVLVCPNFAIGAILMMKFAVEASKYLNQVEIIEYHHTQKADSPSGTAIKTADAIYDAGHPVNPELEDLQKTELIKGVRGGAQHRIPIHSVRASGYVATQDVVLGGIGQTLTIRHDTINRDGFMPGILLALEKVSQLKGLVYGLENVMDH